MAERVGFTRWQALAVASAVGAVLVVDGERPLVAHADAVRVEAVTGPASGVAPAVRGRSHDADPDPAVGGLESVVFGTSVGGKPIVAHHRMGSAQPTRTVLAIGVIHGDEGAGAQITDQLLSIPVPVGVDLWWVPTLNPDGAELGRAGNANGVDLNRNWPTDWAPPGGGHTSGKHHSGAGPSSEPEVRSMMVLIEEVEPDVTVWYHQPWGYVDCHEPRADAACVEYATEVGMAVDFRERPGTATAWIRSGGHGESFVVELGWGRLSPTVAAVHAAALLTL